MKKGAAPRRKFGALYRKGGKAGGDPVADDGPVSVVSCKHCGSPIPSTRDDGFCCTGCVYVHELLHQQGLDHFYDLKGDLRLPPVSPQTLRERDYEWLEQMAREKETGAIEPVELRLALQGISCIGCVWLIERVFSRHSGGLRINVDVLNGTLLITWQPAAFDVVAFARDLHSFGYLVGPPVEGDEGKQSGGLERRMGACGAFAMNAMAFSLPAYFGMPKTFPFASWFDLIAAASATLAMLVGGSYFISKSWQSLRLGILHIDTPIALGIVAAYAGSIGGWIAGVEGLKYFDFVAIFTFLMLVGRWAQQAAVERNRRRLMRDTSIPDSVLLVDADKPKPLGEMKIGEVFLVKPGQSVPVASKLRSLNASLSLEWINGESEAQHRTEGQMLPSGALNISQQTLEAEALEAWEKSSLRRLLDARRPMEFRDLRLERLLRWYLAVVVLVGVAGGIWWLMSGAPVAQALQVMISIFVVSCPCALGVAVPLAEELATSRAERHGVFVRTLGLWKRLNRVRKVAFDKTGTLTLENPVLENPEVLAGLDADATAALRSLVTGNLHPVSRCLFDELGPERRDLETASQQAEETAGHGLSWRDAVGVEWTLTRSSDGGADAVFGRNGVTLAAFHFKDRMRSDSVQEVRNLESRGIDVHILSGDRDAKVAAIAEQLRLPRGNWHAAMLPEDKASWVKQHNRDDLLFLGDGANDSLAFDAALAAGIPFTGRSFLEQKADFFFLGHSLRFVSSLLDVAARHRLATRRVFGFSLSYNIVTVIAGLAGHLSPLAAAILMPLSSLVTLSIVAATFRKRAEVNDDQAAVDGDRNPERRTTLSIEVAAI